MAYRSRAWFVEKIRELGELLKRMPEGREDALWRQIDEASGHDAEPEDPAPSSRVDGSTDRAGPDRRDD